MSWWQRPGSDSRGVAVAPSLLSADAARLAEELAAVDDAGADLIHLDIMDGHFVPNLTYGPHVAKAVVAHTRLSVDAHLMVTDPGAYAPAFLDAGCTSISFHYELDLDHAALLRTLRDRGAKAGLALNPSTPLDRGFRDLLPELDFVLVMSVHPGFGGQSFDAAALPKLEQLVGWRAEDGLDFVLEIDGGINPETAAQAREAGAQILVSGSTLFRADDRASMVRQLRGG